MGVFAMNDRIVRLERSNRRLWIAVASVISIAAVALFAGAGVAETDEMTVKRLNVESLLLWYKGKVVGGLVVAPDTEQATLELYHDGVSRTHILPGAIGLNDEKQRPRILISTEPKYTGPMIGVADTKGKFRLVLSHDANDTTLGIYDARGKDRLKLTHFYGPAVTGDMSFAAIFSDDTEMVWSAGDVGQGKASNNTTPRK